MTRWLSPRDKARFLKAKAAAKARSKAKPKQARRHGMQRGRR